MTRLNSMMRATLRGEVERTVRPKKEAAALDAAYAEAKKFALKEIILRFPKSDMATLKKYSAAEHDECAQFRLADGQMVEFMFAEADAPALPNHSCTRRVFLANAETSAAIEAWREALEVFRAEHHKRQNAYVSLIDNSSTLEAVTAMWPEAASLFSPDNALMVLPAETLAIINADRAERS